MVPHACAPKIRRASSGYTLPVTTSYADFVRSQSSPSAASGSHRMTVRIMAACRHAWMKKCLLSRAVATMHAPSLFIVCQCLSIRSWKWRYGADHSSAILSSAAVSLNSAQSKIVPLSTRTVLIGALYSDRYSCIRSRRNCAAILPVGSAQPMASKRSNASSTAPRIAIQPVVAAGYLA